MKRSVQYAILLVVIAAAAGYLLNRSADRRHYRLPAMAVIAPGQINRIEILRPSGPTVIQKQADQWRLVPGDYPVDPDKINAVLDAAGKLALSALVSESSDYSRYDLTEKGRITVKVFVGDELKRQFDVGKAAPSFRHTFVKMEGDPRVYQAIDNFRRHFDQSVDNLRDKTVMRLDAQTVKGIRVAKGSQVLTFHAVKTSMQDQAQNPGQPTGWQQPDGTPVDSQAVERLLASLGNLRCTSFVYEPSKADFVNPIYEVVLESDASHRLAIFASRSDEVPAYPAVSSLSPYPFYLSAAEAEAIMNALTLPPAPTSMPGKVKKAK